MLESKIARHQSDATTGGARLSPKALLLEDQLAQILASLAHLLLRNGYGFSRVSKLTKIAFVDAAKAIDVESTSKLSIARIAAVTGLTRIDVSRLLRTTGVRRTTILEPMNRAAQVATGWVSDKAFRDANGHPKKLPFTSTRASFSALVKKYSGDIPARAMLSEMKRLGMVRHDSSDTVRLEKARQPSSRLTISAVRAITPWVNFLADVEKIGKRGALTSNARKFQLQFDSFPQVLAATREIEKRRAIFVESLRHLGSGSNQSVRFQLDVSVAVALAAVRPTSIAKKQ